MYQTYNQPIVIVWYYYNCHQICCYDYHHSKKTQFKVQENKMTIFESIGNIKVLSVK